MSNKAIPIPNTTSSPAHAGYSLLRLEGEIRNLLYAQLFEASGPILFNYADNDAYMSLDANGDDIIDESKMACPTVLQRLLSDDPTTSNIKGGLGLLRTCRQIYYEAASVLYSNNVFRFGMDPKEHIKYFGQLPLAVSFCTSLGFSLQFLRHVDIDMSHVCAGGWCSRAAVGRAPSRGHQGPSHCVDFDGVAKLVWKSAAAKCKIRFMTSAELAFGPPTFLESINNKSEFDILILNNLLVCLRNDTADLKRYAGQIDWIQLWARSCTFDEDEGSRGWVRLQYRRTEPAPQYSFDLLFDDNGTGLRRRAMFKPSLMEIPRTVRHEIYRDVMCSADGVVVDLDTGKRSVSDGLGLLNLKTHGVFDYPLPPPRQLLWERNKFLIRMSSSKSVLPSDDFGPVQDVLCKDKTENNWQYPWKGRHGHHDCGPVRLELNFKLEDKLTLADVRIGVMSLIRLTSTFNGRRFDIDFNLMPSHNGGGILEQRTVSLHSVRARVLELLSQVIGKTPKRLHSTQFEVFIDGHGEVKSMELTIDNAKHTFDAVSYTKKKIVAEVVKRYGFLIDPTSNYKTDQTRYDGTLWCWLRFLEEVIFKEPKDYQGRTEMLACHARYFGVYVAPAMHPPVKNYLWRNEKTAPKKWLTAYQD